MKASFDELEAGQTLRSSSVLPVQTRKTMRDRQTVQLFVQGSKGWAINFI